MVEREAVMAWTQADLDTLRAHMASGVQKVRYADGREVTYHSLDQMLAAEKVISAAISMADASSSSVIRRKFASFKSGC
jgi:protein-disulfide isomerase-like protein with CxxC motif